MGERTPVAIHAGPAAARLAVAEAVTNIVAADVAELGDIRLSANWMAAAGHGNDDYALFSMVEAVGEKLCPELGIAIPVGKDSLSMRTVWRDGRGEHAVTSPVSLIVSAFAPVRDVRRTLTPELSREPDTVLVLIDLANGAQRLGGSCLAQSFGQYGGEPPDLDEPERLKAFFAAQRQLRTRICCSLITIAPTAVFSSRWPRWRSRAELASTSRCPRKPRTRSGICSPKSSAPSCRYARPTCRVCRACSSSAVSRTSSPRGPRATAISSFDVAPMCSTAARASICSGGGRSLRTGCRPCATTPNAPARLSRHLSIRTIRA